MTAIPADSGFFETLRKLPSAQKSSRGAPAYSRFINRPLGRYLAVIAYRANLTPNQVTAISALFTFSGITALALFRPAPWLGLLVFLTLVIGYALDSADGQLARLRGGGSLAGEWLDHIVDSVKIAALHMAVLVSFYRFAPDNSARLLIPMGFEIVAVVTFFALILTDQLRRQKSATKIESPGQTKTSLAQSLLVLPIDYGLLCVTFLLFGFTTLFSIIYLLLFAAAVVYLAAALIKWFRDMTKLDQLENSSKVKG